MPCPEHAKCLLRGSRSTDKPHRSQLSMPQNHKQPETKLNKTKVTDASDSFRPTKYPIQ